MSAAFAPPPDHAAIGGAVGWLLALVAACVCALVLAFAPPAQELQAQDIDLDLDSMVLVAAADAGDDDDDVRSLSVEPPCDADASDHKALPGLTLPSIVASHTLAPTAIAGRPQRSEPPPQRPPRALA